MEEDIICIKIIYVYMRHDVSLTLTKSLFKQIYIRCQSVNKMNVCQISFLCFW